MLVAGLTGSIGMGKSTVAAMLRDMGVPVHDSDAAVHRALAPGGAGVAAVAALFPETARTGDDGQPFIDRKALGARVFGKPDRLRALEDILHPLARAAQEDFLARQRAAGARLVVLDIPLLFETGAEKRLDVTFCVSAPKDIQYDRVVRGRGMDAEKFAAILAAQMPDAEKRRRADYVIDTGVPPEETRKAVAALVEKLLQEGARHDQSPAGKKNRDSKSKNPD